MSDLKRVLLLTGMLLPAWSCQDASEPEPAQHKVVGPAGADVTQRPAIPASQGDVVLEGCCSFAPGDHAVEELFGDFQGWKVSGDRFELVFSYGASLEPAPDLPGSSRTSIDGVTVKSTALKPGTGEIPVLTAVLDASSLDGLQVVDPRLTVFGQCESESGCADARVVLDSLRF
jgi:hypothetical protein